MLLQSIEFVTDGLLVLNGFIMRNLELLHFHRLVLGLHVLMLIGLEKLTLCCLVLLILLLEVAKIAVQFVQSVFEVLNLLNGVLCFVVCTRYRVLLLFQHIRNGRDAMVVILELGMKHVQAFLLCIYIFIEVK
jgi:hypothetical protein